MLSRTNRFYMQFFLAFTFGMSPLLESAALAQAADAAPNGPPKQCSSAVKKFKALCEDLGTSAGDSVQAKLDSAKALAPAGIQGQASSQAGALSSGSGDLNTAADKCESGKNACDSCKGSTDQETQDLQKKCNEAFTNFAASERTDAQSLGSTADNSQNTADAASADKPPGDAKSGGGGDMSSLGPMLGMAALGLGAMMMMKKNDSSASDNASAFNADTGTVDCSKADAAQYSDCTTYLTNTCTPQLASGQLTASCAAFTSSYCSSTVAAGSQTTRQISTGSAVQVNIAGTGDGHDGTYFQAAFQHANCDGHADRQTCPACSQLASSSSAACTANPSECLAQNSISQLNAMTKLCPNDPTIALAQKTNPGAVATGAPGDPSTPVVVPTLSTSGISTSSVSRSADSIMPSSVSTGPASDVQGQFGPSVFAMGSQLLRQHCQTGKLNCP
jgi:hypothetical protein